MYTVVQGTLVPKLTLGPFLTLSVRMGTNWKIGFLGSRPISRPLSRVKVDIKTITNVLLNVTRTTINNFKLFLLNQNYNRSFFYIKSLGLTYPEFETLSHFRDKTHFPVFEYNPQFKIKLTFITYKINHWKQKLS